MVEITCCNAGITPAYAGKRKRSPFSIFVTGDHPRLCGEKIPQLNKVVLAEGSPPPMRGKVQLFHQVPP